MYKIPITILEEIVDALEISTKTLKKIAETNDSIHIQSAIIKNERQIKKIKLNFPYK
jgi:hypothetical protein